MEFKRFDRGAMRLPPARVSALPTFSLASVRWRLGSAAAAAAASKSGLRHYARSRYALTEAFRLCGVGAAGTLVAPAYHCRTMIDPALRLGARVHLYPLQPDLRPDLVALQALLADPATRAGAVLATHYFGFQQDWSDLLALCRKHGVALIEDCSHCLSAQAGVNGLGSSGRYAVWSPYKFYGCEDGGELQCNQDTSASQRILRPRSLLDELKAAYHLLQRSRKSIRLRDLRQLDAELAAIPNTAQAAGFVAPEFQASPSSEYNPAIEECSPLRLSRWIIENTALERLRARRRSRYGQWLQATCGLPHCRPLFAVLPDECVPYMFALHIDDPQTHFMPLKRLGMPVWRWDNMAVSPCSVSDNYRLHLLQLPCHQELGDIEFDWMRAAVTAVLQGGPATGP